MEKLSQVVLGSLSILSEKYGQDVVKVTNLYHYFAVLREEFPDLVPDLKITVIGSTPYSEVLGYALMEAIDAGIIVIDDVDSEYLAISQATAKRNIEILRVQSGEMFIKKMEWLGTRLNDMVKEPDPNAPHAA